MPLARLYDPRVDRMGRRADVTWYMVLFPFYSIWRVLYPKSSINEEDSGLDGPTQVHKTLPEALALICFEITIAAEIDW